MFLVPFACFAFKLIMALVGGGENVPVQEESEINDHSEVVKANGEVDGPVEEGHALIDGGSVPKDEKHVSSVGSEVQVPTESPPVVTVRKRGRPRLKPKLSGGENSVKKVIKPKKKVVATPKFQPTTPVSSDRPVRERKSVKRFISASAEEASREFVVQKGSGSGTALKDIPNVAYKISRKSKGDQILKLLHTVIYGKRVKALHIKNNILQFSGFEPGENKNSEKVKEKLEKLHKENLGNLCDVLDLQLSINITKKEELVSKLFEFLEAPHITQNILPEEKEQSSKHRKRKRADSETLGRTLGEITEKREQNFNGSSGEDEAKRELNYGDNEAEKQSKYRESEFGKKLQGVSTEKESLKEQHDDEDHEAKRKISNKSAKKGSKRKADGENVEKRDDEKQGKQIYRTDLTDKKSNLNDIDANLRKYKDETENKKMPTKALKGKSKGADKKANSLNSGKLGEREDAEINAKRKRDRKPSKSKIEKTGDSSSEVKDAIGKDQHMYVKSEATYGRKETKDQTDRMAEGKNKAQVKANVADPTEEQLRFVIRELLHEVDFNTATLSDVVKRLGGRFDKDFTERKAYIRILVQEELTKIAEDDNDDDEHNQDED